MQTARRLYLYLLSGIGLGVLVAGVSLLLTTLLDTIGIDSSTVFSGEQATRERLTLATAMSAVSLPVWLIHWLVIQRGVRPGRPEADTERSSAVRGLYFALVMGGLLLAMVLSLLSLVEGLLQRIVGADSFGFGDPAGQIGLLVAAGAAWGYHLAVRLDDWGRGVITGAAAWLPRAYLYGATFIGLMLLLFGLADLLALVARLLANAGEDTIVGGGGPWWSYPLASGIARALVGGAAWLGHVWYARRLWADPGERGAIERPARLRFAFYVAVLVVSAAAAIGFLGQVGRLLIGAALGLPGDSGTGGLAGDLLAPVLSSALFAASWWVHAAELRRASEDPRAAASVARPGRLVAYPTALVGLAVGAAATARLIGLALDQVLGGGQVIGGGTSSERAFADVAPYAILGIGLWLWHWSGAMRAAAADPAGEAASTIRRASLLVTLAVAVLGGVASLGVILYRLFGTLFGLDVPVSVGSELSFPIGALLVTATVALYHGGLLRRDGALREGQAAVDTADDAPAVARPEMALVLVGPDGVEPGTLAGVADGLRAQLPEGFELRDERRMS
jgi:hypothetical protein